MSDKFFLDTNIIVYSFDPDDADKQSQAATIIRQALTEQNACVSFQVIQEFCNVATRKFATPLSYQDCRIYLTDVLAPLCEVFPSIELYTQALQIAERFKYSFYDSLIISAA